MMQAAMASSRWIIGAAALVLLPVLMWSSLAQAQDEGPIPGGTYSGTFVDTSGVCDEGDLIIGEGFSLKLNAHGTSIVELTVNELTYLGSSVGPYVVPGDIQIDTDGTFAGDIDVSGAGVALLHFEGRFEGDSVSGSFSVELSGTLECAGTFTAQGSPPPERPPRTLEGEIDIVDEDCGGGSISVTVSGDRLSVIAVEVSDLNADGASVSGSATFDEGTVPIAEDWTFGWVYFPGSEAGQEIAVSGRFASEALFLLSGVVTVTPSACGAMPLLVIPTSLGRGGTGPAAGSDSGAVLWMVLAASLGAFGLATTGLAVMRRRSA